LAGGKKQKLGKKTKTPLKRNQKNQVKAPKNNKVNNENPAQKLDIFKNQKGVGTV